VEYTEAQARIIAAALELFAEHGVGGTSLQMIADEIGVTKAAVYHQFPTKDEIVVAVAQGELARVAAVVDAAEAEPDRSSAREVLIAGIVDLAVERRRMETTLLGDPVLIRYFARHKPFHHVMTRLYALLDDETSGVSAVMLTAAIGGAVMHPLVADFDDETLRAQLLQLARRFLDLS
jgi:AcrR family transcriptional regulator